MKRILLVLLVTVVLWARTVHSEPQLQIDGITSLTNGDATITVKPLSLAQTPWPMFGSDLSHSGQGARTEITYPEVKWTYDLGSITYSSAAIGIDGSLYLGCRDHQIYRLNPNNGQLLASYTTGGIVDSSAAIVNDASLYIGSHDNCLYWLKQDLTLIWKKRLGGWVESSPAIGSDGSVYIGSGDGKLYSLRADGTIAWSFQTNGHIYSSPAIDEAGNIYVGSDDHHLYSLTRDGRLRWRFNTLGPIHSSPVIAGANLIRQITSAMSGQTIYIGADALYALDAATGFPKWRYATDGYLTASPVLGTEGTIYSGSEDGRLYILNQDGSLMASFTTSGKITAQASIDADNNVYLGSRDGYLYCLTPEGKLRWKYAILGGLASSPVIGAGNTIYVATRAGRVYAITNGNWIPDTNPPATVTDLSVVAHSDTSVDLSFTAPGDNGTTGAAAYYEVWYAAFPSNGTSTNLPILPQAAGTKIVCSLSGLAANTTYSFGLRSVDQAGNISGLSNIATATTSKVDGFTFDTIGIQLAGLPFQITIKAANDNYQGRGSITALTGSITPSFTGSFTSGIWSGTITIAYPGTYNLIFVDATSELRGTSNAFIVANKPQPIAIPSNNWIMVSIPLDISAEPKAVFGSQTRVFYWNPQLEETLPFLRFEVPDRIKSGHAYWIKSPETMALTFMGRPIKGTQSIPIYEGWNMIGNPFLGLDVEWSNNLHFQTNTTTENLAEAVYNSNSLERALWGYSKNEPGRIGYRIAHQLLPWRGYFVMAKKAGQLIIPPIEAHHHPLPAPKADNSNDWQIQLSVASADYADTDNFIGSSWWAKDDYDAQDLSEPPFISPYVSLSILHPTTGVMASDIRQPIKKLGVWELMVRSDIQEKELSLSWQGIASLPADYDIYLTDNQTKTNINLRQQTSYSFKSEDGPTQRRFTLKVGHPSEVQAALTELKILKAYAYPNPMNQSTTFKCQLSRNGDRVRLRIYSIAGELIKEAEMEEQPTNSYQYNWDGTNNASHIIASGLYIYLITVEQNGQTDRAIGKIGVIH